MRHAPCCHPNPNTTTHKVREPAHDYGRFGRGDDEGAAEGGFQGPDMSNPRPSHLQHHEAGSSAGQTGQSSGQHIDPVELGRRAADAMVAEGGCVERGEVRGRGEGASSSSEGSAAAVRGGREGSERDEEDALALNPSWGEDVIGCRAVMVLERWPADGLPSFNTNRGVEALTCCVIQMLAATTIQMQA